VDGGPYVNIGTGVPGYVYPWVMTSDAIGSEVLIRITDGVFTTVSEPFEVVDEPRSG